MNEYTLIIFKQILIMLMLMACGMIGYKTKIITKEGSKALSDLLVLLVSPVVIFTSYQRDFDPAMLLGLIEAFFISLLGFAAAGVVAYVCLRKKGKSDIPVERFSVIYSNCGFMGIPLVQALFGAEGVFYITAVITAFNVLAWTHGVMLFVSGTDRKFDPKGLKKALTSPNLIAVPLGLIFFVTSVRLPEFMGTALNYVAGMNTPLAMIIAGATVAQTSLKKTFTNPRAYLVTLLKLLIAPVLILLVISLFRLPTVVSLTVLVGLSSPTAAMGTIFALSYDRDAVYASELFAITTLLSAVSLPVIVWLSGFLL